MHTSMSPADESSPYRTEKLEEFGHQSWAEICWYLNDTREQFRLGGQLASIDGSDPDKAMLQVMFWAQILADCSMRLWTYCPSARQSVSWSNLASLMPAET